MNTIKWHCYSQGAILNSDVVHIYLNEKGNNIVTAIDGNVYACANKAWECGSGEDSIVCLEGCWPICWIKPTPPMTTAYIEAMLEEVLLTA
jgi:hypothetical protein